MVTQVRIHAEEPGAHRVSRHLLQQELGDLVGVAQPRADPNSFYPARATGFIQAPGSCVRRRMGLWDPAPAGTLLAPPSGWPKSLRDLRNQHRCPFPERPRTPADSRRPAPWWCADRPPRSPTKAPPGMAVEMAVNHGLVEPFSGPKCSLFGLYKPFSWWRRLGSNQRREAYEFSGMTFAAVLG